MTACRNAVPARVTVQLEQQCLNSIESSDAACHVSAQTKRVTLGMALSSCFGAVSVYLMRMT